MVPNWVYGAMALILLTRLAAMSYAWVQGPGRGRRGEFDADGAERRVDADGDTVECPSCGAENELGYRFCRNCVSELPGVSPARFAGGPSRTGRLM